MKPKINIYKVMWVSSIFILLITILIMVMDYKINYQGIQLETEYVYFYNCDGEICTSQIKDTSKELYSTFDCENQSCPVYKGIINEDYAILEEPAGQILYNYKTGVKITAGYDSYIFINNKYIITSKADKYGIITDEDDVIVDTIYNQIGIQEENNLKGYNNEMIIALKDNKYGLISYKDGSIKEDFKYDSKEKLLEKLK